MAYWIRNFENYIDTWLELDYPKDYRIYTIRYKHGDNITTEYIAHVKDDSTYQTMLDQQSTYNFKVEKGLYLYQLNTKGTWRVNTKHKKYFGQYYIEPNDQNFDDEYYRIKDMICKKFMKPLSKHDMISKLCTNNTNNLCVLLDNITPSDLMFMKLSGHERLVY